MLWCVNLKESDSFGPGIHENLCNKPSVSNIGEKLFWSILGLLKYPVEMGESKGGRRGLKKKSTWRGCGAAPRTETAASRYGSGGTSTRMQFVSVWDSAVPDGKEKTTLHSMDPFAKYLRNSFLYRCKLVSGTCGRQPYINTGWHIPLFLFPGIINMEGALSKKQFLFSCQLNQGKDVMCHPVQITANILLSPAANLSESLKFMIWLIWIMKMQRTGNLACQNRQNLFMNSHEEAFDGRRLNLTSRRVMGSLGTHVAPLLPSLGLQSPSPSSPSPGGVRSPKTTTETKPGQPPRCSRGRTRMWIGTMPAFRRRATAFVFWPVRHMFLFFPKSKVGKELFCQDI